MSEQPATLRLEFVVPHGRVVEFSRLVEGMGSDATTGFGATGVDAVAADRSEADERWVVSVRFEDEAALRRWRASDESGRWRDQLEGISAEQPLVRIRSGVEVWFEPASRHAASPPKWKMASLSAAGIYPAILLLDFVLAPVRARMPPWAASLLVVCILSALVTWVIMPTLTRLFRGWLYPDLRPGREQGCSGPR